MTDQTPNQTLAPAPLPERPPARGGSPIPWVIPLVLASMLGAILFAGGYPAAGAANEQGTCSPPRHASSPACES